MTSIDCVNGTERLIELVQDGRLKGDIFVNWQGMSLLSIAQSSVIFTDFQQKR